MYMAIENDLFDMHFSNALSIYGKWERIRLRLMHLN